MSLRKAMPNLLLLLGSLMLASIGTEVGLRLSLQDALSTKRLQEQVDRTWLGEFTQPSRRPGLHYELKAGADVNWGGVRVVTSVDGSRRISSARPAPSADPALKVALLGDSSSFGWGVDYSDTYGEQLRQMLERWLRRPVELGNFSVPGYNSQQERLCFEAHVLPWQPDLVILHHDFNDPDPIEGKPLNYMAADYGDNPLHSVAIKWALRGLYQRRIDRVMWVSAEDPEHRTQVYRHYRCAGPRYDQHLRELEAIAQEAARHRIRLLAFVFNTWVERRPDPARDPYYTLLHQPIVRALESYGYSVLDSYPLYQKVMADHDWDNLMLLWIAPGDGHPNPAGHALIARALFQHIVSTGIVQGPAPLESKE